MSFDVTKPANNEFIAAGPAEMRENFRALKDDRIVDAGSVQGLSPGNNSGQIAVANGNLCTNLNAEKVGGKLATDLAAVNHIHATATGSSNGFMANTDKQKLDTVTAGAQPNQNTFANVLVGTTTIQADAPTDVLELVAGTGITLTPDAAYDRLTITSHINVNDPDANQKAALAGTSGTPSGTNKYVTNNDTRLTDSRTPVAHKNSHKAGGSDVLTPGDIGAVTTGDSNIFETDGKTVKNATKASNGVPVGAVFYFAIQTPSAGFLECNGAAVSRTTYATLFAAIGITFGSGDGSTTFNLPDLRGEFIRGWDHGRGIETKDFGSWEGDLYAYHNHTILRSSSAATYGYDQGSGQTSFNVGCVNHSLPISISYNGGNETRPRNIALLPCIKY